MSDYDDYDEEPREEVLVYYTPYDGSGDEKEPEEFDEKEDSQTRIKRVLKTLKKSSLVADSLFCSQ